MQVKYTVMKYYATIAWSALLSSAVSGWLSRQWHCWMYDGFDMVVVTSSIAALSLVAVSLFFLLVLHW